MLNKVFDYWDTGSQSLQILMVISLGCLSSQSLTQQSSVSPKSVATVVKFLDRTNLEFAIDVERNAIKNGVTIDFLGITAVDKNTALLYGLSDVGSILLRTDDGGKHWQEVLTPQFGTRVRWVAFADNLTGWALVEYFQGEAGGEITLHQTRDAGLTWKKLAMVPTDGTYWEPINVRFFDRALGQIEIFNYTQDKCATTLQTVNGGRSWQETNRECFENEWAANVYLKARPIDLTRSTGRDGSYWQFQAGVGTTPKILVQRRLADRQLSTVSVISRQWRYKNHRIRGWSIQNP